MNAHGTPFFCNAMLSAEKQAEILKRLMEPFPDDAIQRTNGRITRKGYDTTGYGYQYIVNRLNEVLGLGGWYDEKTYDVTVGETKMGEGKWSAICYLTIYFGEWRTAEDGTMRFVYWAKRECIGNHTSPGSEGDARKGAYTNAIKKTAALFGCGHQAYLGILDDDNLPAETHPQEARPASAAQTQATAQPRPQAIRNQQKPIRTSNPNPPHSQIKDSYDDTNTPPRQAPSPETQSSTERIPAPQSPSSGQAGPTRPQASPSTPPRTPPPRRPPTQPPQQPQPPQQARQGEVRVVNMQTR